jgi:hypothetical protein
MRPDPSWARSAHCHHMRTISAVVVWLSRIASVRGSKIAGALTPPPPPPSSCSSRPRRLAGRRDGRYLRPRVRARAGGGPGDRRRGTVAPFAYAGRLSPFGMLCITPGGPRGVTLRPGIRGRCGRVWYVIGADGCVSGRGRVNDRGSLRPGDRAPRGGRGEPSPGRHCPSTLSSAAIACHSLGIYTAILLPLRSCSVEMMVPPSGQASWADEETLYHNMLGSKVRTFSAGHFASSARFWPAFIGGGLRITARQVDAGATDLSVWQLLVILALIVQKNAVSAVHPGHLQPFRAAFPRECMGQLPPSGPA